MFRYAQQTNIQIRDLYSLDGWFVYDGYLPSDIKSSFDFVPNIPTAVPKLQINVSYAQQTNIQIRDLYSLYGWFVYDGYLPSDIKSPLDFVPNIPTAVPK